MLHFRDIGVRNFYAARLP